METGIVVALLALAGVIATAAAGLYGNRRRDRGADEAAYRDDLREDRDRAYEREERHRTARETAEQQRDEARRERDAANAAKDDAMAKERASLTALEAMTYKLADAEKELAAARRELRDLQDEHGLPARRATDGAPPAADDPPIAQLLHDAPDDTEGP